MPQNQPTHPAPPRPPPLPLPELHVLDDVPSYIVHCPKIPPPPLPLPELHVLDDVPSFIFVQAKYSVEVWLLCSCSFCCFF